MSPPDSDNNENTVSEEVATTTSNAQNSTVEAAPAQTVPRGQDGSKSGPPSKSIPPVCYNIYNLFALVSVAEDVEFVSAILNEMSRL